MLIFDFNIVQEQELYQKEGLGVNEVHYVDNQDCIGRFCLPPSQAFDCVQVRVFHFKKSFTTKLSDTYYKEREV